MKRPALPADQAVSHRFRCTCGRENRFTVAYGAARKVKVRCGACRLVCGVEIPDSSPDKAAADFLGKIGLDRGLFGDLFKGR